MRKGQITIFAIIGVLVFLLFTIYLLASEKEEKIDGPNSRSDSLAAKAYVESCLESELKRGLVVTGLDERELEKHIDNEVKKCIEAGDLEKIGLVAGERGPRSSVRLNNDALVVDFDYPMWIAKEGKKESLRGFSSKISLSEYAKMNAERQQRLATDDGFLEMIIPPRTTALLNNAEISRIDLRIVDSGEDPVVFSSVSYDLQPNEATLIEEAKITIKYEEADLPVGFDEKDLTILIRESENSPWIPLNTFVDTERNSLEAELPFLGIVSFGPRDPEKAYIEIVGLSVNGAGSLSPKIVNFSKEFGIIELPQVAGIESDEKYVYAIANVAPGSYQGPGAIVRCDMNAGSCAKIGGIEKCDPDQGFQKIRSIDGKMYILPSDAMDEHNVRVWGVVGNEVGYVMSFPERKRGSDILRFMNATYMLGGPQEMAAGTPCFQGGSPGMVMYCTGCKQSDLAKMNDGTPKTMTVWRGRLLLSSGMGAGNSQISSYDGNNFTKIKTDVPYDLEYARQFKDELYVFSNYGLFRTKNGENFTQVDFFKDHGCLVGAKKFLSDIAVLDNRLYISVIEGTQTGYDWLEDTNFIDDVKKFFSGDCSEYHQSSVKERINTLKIYSSEDGDTWDLMFSAPSGLERVEARAKFPMVSFGGRLYAAASVSSGERIGTGASYFVGSITEKEGHIITSPMYLENFTSAGLSWKATDSIRVVLQYRTASSVDEIENVEFISTSDIEPLIGTQNYEVHPMKGGDVYIQLKATFEKADPKAIGKINEIKISRDDLGFAQRQIGIIKYS